MNIGFVILCRFSSRRLPGKILKEIQGKPILQYIYDNLLQVSKAQNLVIATSTDKTDDQVAQYCKEKNIQCFRGALNNVAERFLAAAKAYKFDFVVRICGDNLFTDVATIRTMLEITQTNAYDFISNVKGRTFPFGMSVEIVRTAFYEQLFSLLTTKEYQEHVTLYLYQHKIGQQYFHYNTICPEAKGIHLAIDTQADFDKATAIVAKMQKPSYKYGIQEIYKLVANA